MEQASASRNSCILILDGETRAALSVVRSLGRAGYQVCCASAVRRPLAAASRFNRQCFRCPDPAVDPASYKTWLVSTVESLKPAMLIPVTDVSLELTFEVEQAVRASTILPFPPRESALLASHKDLLIRRASALGLNCPQTMTLSFEDLGHSDVSRAVEQFAYPACLKPVESQSRKAGGFSHFRVRYPETPGEVAAWAKVSGVPLLLQEYIKGDGVGYFALCATGEPIAEFAHRRLLEKPPSGGVSVLSESIPLSEAPVEESRRLLRALEWTGVAMVEYKRKADGSFWLMEINPRFWGSLQLAVDAGRDFPRYLCELFFPDDEPLLARAQRIRRTIGEYRPGQRLRWSLGTVDHLLINLKTSKAQAFREALISNSLRLFERPCRTRLETFRADDPQPFFRELWSYCGL